MSYLEILRKEKKRIESELLEAKKKIAIEVDLAAAAARELKEQKRERVSENLLVENMRLKQLCAIHLRHGLGQTYKAAAENMGVSVDTIKSYLIKAERSLKSPNLI